MNTNEVINMFIIIKTMRALLTIDYVDIDQSLSSKSNKQVIYY